MDRNYQRELENLIKESESDVLNYIYIAAAHPAAAMFLHI